MGAPKGSAVACAIGMLGALTGCTRSAWRPASQPDASLPPTTLQPPTDSSLSLVPGSVRGSADFGTVQVQAAQVYSVQRVQRLSALTTSVAGAPPPSPPSLPAQQAADAAPVRKEMREREARLAIEVDDVPSADARLQALILAFHGEVVSDNVSIGGARSEATVVARIPDADLDPLLARSGDVGVLRAKDLSMHDVGKEYFDAQVLERNLVDELARTQELLKSATNLTDTLAVENHLEQLRTKLDQVRGNLQYMRDHVERAALSVHLVAQGAESTILRPEAGLFPSLRGAVALDWRKAGQPNGYAGGGFSLALPSIFGIQVSRGWAFDVDVLTQAFGGVPTGGKLDFLLMTGTDTYSDFFGGGHRTFFNPYLGWRVGYAQSESMGDAALGVVVGVDLLKTSALLVPLQFEAVGMAGNANGPHAALLPSLGLVLAF
jgi:hypothetical protein